MLRRLACFWIAIALCLTGARAAHADEQIWFDDLRDIRLDDRIDIASLAKLTWETLNEKKDITTQWPAAWQDDGKPRIVMLSICDGRTPATVVAGRGDGMRAAILSAFESLMLIPDAPKRPKWVKLDVVTAAVPVRMKVGVGFTGEGKDLEAALRYRIEDGYEVGFFGLALDRTADVALLPEQITMWRMIDNTGILNKDAILAFCKTRPKHAVAFKRALTAPDGVQEVLDKVRQDLQQAIARGDDPEQMPKPKLGAVRTQGRAFLFTTTSIFVDEFGATRLYRGHPTISRFSRERLLFSCHLAGRYLASHVRDDGTFDYLYHTGSGEVEADYNELRHAGSVWAMLQVYGKTNDKRILEAAIRGMERMLEIVKDYEVFREETRKAKVLVSKKGTMASLGGNALAILVLSEYTRVTGDKKYLPTMRLLAEWILAVQAADGRYRVHRHEFPGGKVLLYESPFYPGEAALAMLSLNRVDPNKLWFDSAARAARWFVLGRDRGVPNEQLPADHWGMYVLNQVHATNPRNADMFAIHAGRIANEMLLRSPVPPDNARHVNRDLAGSLVRSHWIGPHGCRLEGLANAYHILRRVEAAGFLEKAKGERRDSEIVFDALTLGAIFAMQMQIGPERAMYCTRPGEVLGAFPRSYDDPSVRIDDIQHTVIGMLGLYDILEEFKIDKPVPLLGRADN